MRRALSEQGVDQPPTGEHGHRPPGLVGELVGRVDADGRAVDDVIQDRVGAIGADLLVMGAYSHSWLRELLFGGITRTVLQSMPVATFMSR